MMGIGAVQFLEYIILYIQKLDAHWQSVIAV